MVSNVKFVSVTCGGGKVVKKKVHRYMVFFKGILYFSFNGKVNILIDIFIKVIRSKS